MSKDSSFCIVLKTTSYADGYFTEILKVKSRLMTFDRFANVKYRYGNAGYSERE
ncbi:MAG: hypothetical protein IJO26_01195 [Clostridium sp.]|nr:hypothetical protein [Clostridium sp.]